MRFRSHIVILVLAVLAPTLIFSAVALNVLLVSERKAALRSMQELARASINVMDREMTYAMATAQTLSTSRVLHSGNFEDFYAQAKASNINRGIGAALIDEHGQQLFNTVRPYGTRIPAPNALARARVGRVIAGGKPVYSDLIKGSATGKFVVSVEYPVTIRDGRRLVVNEWMFSDHLTRLLPAQDIPASWLIAVFDKQGVTIARNKSPEKFVGEPPRPERLRTILAGFEGISRAYTRDGIEMYGAWERSSLTGWSVGVGVPVAEIEKTAFQSVMLTAAGFATALLLAVWGALLISRRLVGAIDRVTAAAHMLPHYQVPPVEDLRVEEMSRLQLALHQAGRLLVTADRSRQDNLCALEAALARAEAAQRLAEEQNRSKDEFLAMLGHELRNPLAAIASGAAMLTMPGIDEERSGKVRAVVQRQTQHLSRLVDDLLDAHRILSGKIHLTRRPVDLKAAVQACVAGFEARGAMRSHRVAVELASVTVEGDPTRIEQMVSNLLDNAIKYTPEGGSVAVSLRAEDGDAVLAIADSGIGLSPELQQKAFDVFVQGKVVNRSKGGLGIGLAVVNSLAQQHGAQLTAHSEGLNRGSVFTLRFPATTQLSPVERPRQDDAASAAGTILIIEDNRDVREVMALMLTEHGFTVHVAETGGAGLEMAGRLQPDLALVDIDLPDMSGYDIASMLRRDARTAAIGLVAVTGYGQEADRARALDAGFDRHLAKPVPLELLLEVISQMQRGGSDRSAPSTPPK